MAFDSRDMDDFWNIDMLIPKKKKKLSPFATGPVTAGYEISGEATRDDSAERKLTLVRGVGEEERESYAPDGYGLIRRITVTRLGDRYDFYESFRRAALLYFDRGGARCDFAPFYSYMPQYSQLSFEQRDYYFYFRECIRRGEYIRTDYSYIYLYVYEILNLPDKIPPREGVTLLIRLWEAYRRSFPRIDATLTAWIEDYCLVHRLPCPVAALGDLLREAISHSKLKEFYFSSPDFDSRYVIDAMIAHLSDYDPRRGKFFGENCELFEQNMRGAMRCVFRRLTVSGELAYSGEPSLLRRDAFPASLCTHKVKSRLEIEYVPLSACDALRREVTAAVRYTENQLRAAVGVKSRLGVNDLPNAIRREIDDYFSRQRMKGGSLAPKMELPEYEHLYSAPEEKLSHSGADEIERASWSTTMRLVEYEEEQPICEPEANAAEPAEVAAPSGLSDDERAALAIAYAYTYGNGQGLSDDAMAERINERFADVIGDVVLEYDGEYYTIIDDYKEDIEEWIV